MTSKRKETMRRKEKRATRLKVKMMMMKNILLWAMLRRTRRSTTPMTTKLLEMKPDPHWQTERFAKPHQRHHSAGVQNQENSVPWPRKI
jgi:type II secretory pathway component PulJ